MQKKTVKEKPRNKRRHKTYRNSKMTGINPNISQ